MTLQEIIQYQKSFDSLHSSAFDWDTEITDENIEILEFLLLSITGELGEMANIVKKIRRGDFLLSQKKEELSEEMADIFIYLIKMSYQLNINIEEAYFKKMHKNFERFSHYGKD